MPLNMRRMLNYRIQRLMSAGLDYCVNCKLDKTFWFSPNNPYHIQAFGIIECLSLLNYGYIGAVNVKGEFNLMYWFIQCEDKVRKIGEEIGAKETYYYCNNENALLNEN